MFSLDCAMMHTEAVIINYYHLNSTLCAHTDHSEIDALDQPLLSLSFGNAAVFLIGGEKKSSSSPTPLLLRSGDIVFMTGPSRLYYHAVPRILLDPFVSELFADDSYIHVKRLNINARQVYRSVREEEEAKERKTSDV